LFEKKPKTQAYVTNSNVQYVVGVCNYKDYGITYSGVMAVMVSIINKDYLMKEVRIKGGAYGANCYINKSGLVCFYSYRDPNLKNTSNVYFEVSEFLKNYQINGREMQKIIIGTINRYIKPKEPSEKSEYALISCLNSVTYEDRVKEVEEILNTNIKDINELGHKLKQPLLNLTLDVVGNRKKIENEKDMFENLIYLT
jgi:presequence protease